MALDIADSGIAYRPGDSIGIAVCNDSTLIDGLLTRLGVEGDRVFAVEAASEAPGGGPLLPHLQWPCTLRHAFTVRNSSSRREFAFLCVMQIPLMCDDDQRFCVCVMVLCMCLTAIHTVSLHNAPQENTHTLQHTLGAPYRWALT